MNESFVIEYKILGDSFDAVGEASSNVKKILKSIGLDPLFIKKISIALYEAEMNAFIHGGGGEMSVYISSDKIIATITDRGPGIENIELAMKEGFSTATEEQRALGFGAGMGLPNIKRNADLLEVNSVVDVGTRKRTGQRRSRRKRSPCT